MFTFVKVPSSLVENKNRYIERKVRRRTA